MKGKGHHIAGYVIMHNHLHALIAFTKTEPTINTIIGNGKRFMAYEMVKRLKERGETKMLEMLAEGVGSRDSRRGKLHEVFKPSFDWKECRSQRFVNQKLNYIHNNPCKGKWNLAESPMDYAHSSAKFYLTGEQGVYEVFHSGMLEDIDLTNSVNE